jgi:pentatricopeptide repeat protein
MDSTPVGSIDSLKWHSAETMILYWSERGVEGVDKAFTILERLVMEGKANPDAGHSIHIYLVHSILKNWNSCIKSNKRTLLPSQVLHKLDQMIGPSKTTSTTPRCFDPNIATYTMILDAAAHCPDPSERLEFTEALLSRLFAESLGEDGNESVRPTKVTIGTVIHGLANSKTVADAQKAERWLRRLQDLYESSVSSSSSSASSDFRPDTITYTIVIRAWANAGKADRAEALLQEMYEEYYLRGNTDVAPTEYTFNTVLAAWSKSSDIHSLTSAEVVLQKMKELSVSNVNLSPNLVSYNSYLSCCVRRRRHLETLEKAETVMEEILNRAVNDRDMIPNTITYTALFKIITGRNDLSGKEKADRAKEWLVRSNSKKVMEDHLLLERIRAMEFGIR